MKATAWKGGCYGIRVGRQNARNHFPTHWSTIDVSIARQVHTFSLTPTFWTTCPKFRGAPIEKWLQSHKLATWRKGKPPRLTLTPLSGRSFRLFVNA